MATKDESRAPAEQTPIRTHAHTLLTSSSFEWEPHPRQNHANRTFCNHFYTTQLSGAFFFLSTSGTQRARKINLSDGTENPYHERRMAESFFLHVVVVGVVDTDKIASAKCASACSIMYIMRKFLARPRGARDGENRADVARSFCVLSTTTKRLPPLTAV